MTTALQFTTDKADKRLIDQIAQRAVSMDREANGANAASITHHRMNISACHASGNPLRLADLLAADDFNFAHDVFGIDRHICRDTGAMLNFFSPRFSARDEVAA